MLETKNKTNSTRLQLDWVHLICNVKTCSENSKNQSVRFRARFTEKKKKIKQPGAFFTPWLTRRPRYTGEISLFQALARSMGLIECGWATCDERAPIFFSRDPARPAPAFTIGPTDREPGTGYGEIWKRSFISTVRLSVHTNPSRKRSLNPRNLGTPFFVFMRKENMLKTDIFKMTGDCCVFKFLRRIADGKHAFSEWKLRFQIPAAYSVDRAWVHLVHNVQNIHLITQKILHL